MPETTIFKTLQNAKARLAPITDTASLDAQILLAHVLGESRAHVIAHRERLLTDDQSARFEALISRREAGEPIAYIIGKRAFYDRAFIVSPAVLIPRPETEHLVESALEFGRKFLKLTAIDIGTGSGAIIVTLKANLPHIVAYATDISPDALDIARQNADLSNVDITFYTGDLLQPAIDRGLTANLITANLPYIETDDLRTLEVRKYEPHLALDGGVDGLDLVRRLLTQCPQVCAEGAQILLEIGAKQGETVRELAQSLLNPRAVDIINDYAGHDRVVKIQL